MLEIIVNAAFSFCAGYGAMTIVIDLYKFIRG